MVDRSDEYDVVLPDEYLLQERLAAHPLSARAVYRELEHAEDPLTIRELATGLRTPERTVRGGLRRLLDDKLINRHILPEDTRQTIYTIANAPREAGQ